MAACSASKRARPTALDAVVTTLTVPGLGLPNGIFVLADGTRIVSSVNLNTILLLQPSGRLATIAGNKDEDGELKDGEGTSARFKNPAGLTVDGAGNVVVADWSNNAIRSVTREGAVVSTLAGNMQAGFADGQGANARFNQPYNVVVAANGHFIVSDTGNHSIRVITPQGVVRTLCGNGQAGFADGHGAAARFNCPCGLALDQEGNLLVADYGNSAIRLVTTGMTMAGVVITVAGNGVKGFADGAGATARFNGPSDIVVDREGTVVVADRNNHRLRKIEGGVVTTLAGSSERGRTDGAGANVRFDEPFRLALDERGLLLVGEAEGEDIMRVVDASLAPPLRKGPVQQEAYPGDAVAGV